MDFLLECIGFPPETDQSDLARQARRMGEPTPWRAPGAEDLRLPLGDGLELRLEVSEGTTTLLPFFRSRNRLRVGVTALRTPSDSPSDVVLTGWADPPVPFPEFPPDPKGEGTFLPGSCELSALLVDARRLPRWMPWGHVLALELAGFALDVDYVGPNGGGRDRIANFMDHGANIRPIGGQDAPGGCIEASMRVRKVCDLTNPVTGQSVKRIEVDAPGRPLNLFVSNWQLECDGLPTPQPGWRIEGSFLLTGRVVGGLPSRSRELRTLFG